MKPSVASPGRGAPDEFASAGEPPPRVPGAGARPVVAAALWAAMPRWFLSGSTPFASFFRCLVTPKPEQETPATGQAFPMPLPYPGVYRRSARRRTSQLCSALRHATNLVVAVLSWLALGCPAAGPSWLSLGKPLTGEQRGAVRRLEALVRVLVHQPEVGPAEMGRVAAKVEAVETQLSRLETIARRLGNFSKHYAGAPHDMHYDFEPRAAEPDPSLRSSSSGRPLSGTAACGWGKGSEACVGFDLGGGESVLKAVFQRTRSSLRTRSRRIPFGPRSRGAANLGKPGGDLPGEAVTSTFPRCALAFRQSSATPAVAQTVASTWPWTLKLLSGHWAKGAQAAGPSTPSSGRASPSIWATRATST